MSKKKTVIIDPLALDACKKACKEYLNNFEWLIGVIKGNKGRLKIPRLALEFFSNTDHQPWSEFYESPTKLSILPLFVFLTPKEVEGFLQDIKTASEEEILQEFINTGFSMDDIVDESLDRLFSDVLPTKKLKITKQVLLTKKGKGILMRSTFFGLPLFFTFTTLFH